MGLPPTTIDLSWPPAPKALRILALLIMLLLLCAQWLPTYWSYGLFHGHGQAAAMSLITLGVFWRSRQHGAHQHSFRMIAMALTAWVSVDLVVFLPHDSLQQHIVTELGFFLYFLILTLELERLERLHRKVSALDSLAAPLFLLGLFGYLLLMPLLHNSVEYDSSFPSQLFYLFMDIYLILRCTSLLWYVDDREWRETLALIRLGLCGVFITDIADGLQGTGLLNTAPSDPWQGMYYLPLLPLFAMAGYMTLPMRRLVPDRCPRNGRWLNSRSYRLLFFGLLPLAIHLFGYRLGVLHPELRAAREVFLLFWLLLVFLLLQQQQKQQLKHEQSTNAVDPGAPPEHLIATPSLPSPLLAIAPVPVIDIPIAAVDDEHEASDLPAEELSVFIAKLQLWLSVHFTDPELDTDDIANAMSVSSRQLQRRLKAETGLSPADYLRRYRMEKAAILLSEGHKAAFVSVAVGFHQQSHFGRVFKAHFGKTPGQYFHDHQNPVAPN